MWRSLIWCLFDAMMASKPWQEGIEAIVLRTVNDQLSLWDAILPPELLVLPGELARVDALLDDPAFFAPFEQRKAFRAKIKWRTGCEGRIDHLKRSYGWNRTELTTLDGARTWCGHGVFAHNLVKISALAA